MGKVRSDAGVPRLTDTEVIFRHSIPEPNSGCWLWLGDVNGWGYGRLGAARRERQAHRLSYRAFVGDIPKGLAILHRCDTRCCVNPQHLRPGTRLQNMQDAVAKDRMARQRGERAGMAKLTWAMVREIRANPNARISAIASRYGVSRRAISLVLEGKTWTESK